MATSGTVAFRPNVEEIITESFERCGVDIQTIYSPKDRKTVYCKKCYLESIS